MSFPSCVQIQKQRTNQNVKVTGDALWTAEMKWI